jgi:hypothetical protein
MSSLGYGNIQFGSLNLLNTLYCPDLQHNFLSISSLTSNGFQFIFTETTCTFQSSTSSTCYVATLKNDLYVIRLSHSSLLATSSARDWHLRLNHLNIQSLRALKQISLSLALKSSTICSLNCNSCNLGKFTRYPFPTSKTTTSSIGALIHTDIAGSFLDVSLTGHPYILTIIDDFSRYAITYLLVRKSEATTCLTKFCSTFKTKTGLPTQTI